MFVTINSFPTSRETDMEHYLFLHGNYVMQSLQMVTLVIRKDEKKQLLLVLKLNS